MLDTYAMSEIANYLREGKDILFQPVRYVKWKDTLGFFIPIVIAPYIWNLIHTALIPPEFKFFEYVIVIGVVLWCLYKILQKVNIILFKDQYYTFGIVIRESLVVTKGYENLYDRIENSEVEILYVSKHPDKAPKYLNGTERYECSSAGVAKVGEFVILVANTDCILSDADFNDTARMNPSLDDATREIFRTFKIEQFIPEDKKEILLKEFEKWGKETEETVYS